MLIGEEEDEDEEVCCDIPDAAGNDCDRISLNV